MTSFIVPDGPDRAWWKSAIVYQIYPASFFDSNGDGIGDLPGIHSKLDYLKDLGVDVLWLSPIYCSPLADMGYDISNYRDIDPRYGTLADWDDLLAGVHARGMKLIMDLVVNHTSDEHEWFVNSASSITSAQRDWYIWRPPRYDENGTRHPPNNWKSIFQGSAWEYHPSSNEYYLHLYVTKQPDLNWENPAVRDAVFDMMAWWIERGCDGFRMDVINLISKVEGLSDAPVVDPEQEFQPASQFYANGPKVHDYVKEMNLRVLSRHDLITVGETPFTEDPSALLGYVLPQNKELNMVFQFELMHIDNQPLAALQPRTWKLSEFKHIITRWQTFERGAGFWNAIYIENHDQARSVSRFGNDTDRWRTLSAKLLAILQTTQSGTLYVYQGEEIGMKNFPRSWSIEEYKDVASQNYWNLMSESRRKKSGKEDVNMSDVLDGLQKKARDHGRTPVQWTADAYGGFTTGTPWMRVNDDYETWNVGKQVSDPGSILAFWKAALKLRREHEVLVYGDFVDLSPIDERVFAYTRSLGSHTALVLMNFGSEVVTYKVNHGAPKGGMELVLCNHPWGDDERLIPVSPLTLKGWEARVYIG